MWVCKYLFVSLLLLLLCVYPEVRLVNHMIILFLTFLRTMPFSTAAAPFYIPTNSAQASQFLHILANTCYFLYVCVCVCTCVDDSCPKVDEVISHCGFFFFEVKILNFSIC